MSYMRDVRARLKILTNRFSALCRCIELLVDEYRIDCYMLPDVQRDFATSTRETRFLTFSTENRVNFMNFISLLFY